jgi:phage anti-repressor protein
MKDDNLEDKQQIGRDSFIPARRGYPAEWLDGVMTPEGIEYHQLLAMAAEVGIPRSTLYGAAQNRDVIRVKNKRTKKTYWVRSKDAANLDRQEVVHAEQSAPLEAVPVTVKVEIALPADDHAMVMIAPFKAVIGGEEVDVINARDLHAWLKSGQDFSNWFRLRTTQGLLVENQDFGFFDRSIENSGRGRPSVDYVVTVDVAMHMALLEQTERGRAIRQDLIDWKKRAKAMARDMASTPSAQMNILDAIIADPAKVAQALISQASVIAAQSAELAQTKQLAITYQKEAESESAKVVELEVHKARLNEELNAYSRYIDAEGYTNISDVARLMGVRQGWFFRFLLKPTAKDGIPEGIGWIFKTTDGYSPYIEVRDKFLVYKRTVVDGKKHNSGSDVVKDVTKFTSKGIQLVSKLLDVYKIGSGLPKEPDLFN